ARRPRPTSDGRGRRRPVRPVHGGRRLGRLPPRGAAGAPAARRADAGAPRGPVPGGLPVQRGRDVLLAGLGHAHRRRFLRRPGRARCRRGGRRVRRPARGGADQHERGQRPADLLQRRPAHPRHRRRGDHRARRPVPGEPGGARAGGREGALRPPSPVWCTDAVKIRLAAVVIALAALGGCSTPPGPDPATPAPTLPEDAIAYDDLLSTDREFPYDNTCDQLGPGTSAEIGGSDTHVLSGLAGPEGCAVGFYTAELEELWIQAQSPPNPSEPRYFPLVWNGEINSSTYHRRLLLDGRYYAVETIDFLGGLPGCYLTVDTGSPNALQFRGIVPEAHATGYGQLNPAFTNYEVDHAGTARFMEDNCPTVERAAVALLRDIDPDGGSLATS